MKNTSLFFTIVILTMFLALSFTFHSCKKEICVDERDDNFEHISKECDQKATVSKFYGEWEMTGIASSIPFNYTISISSAPTLYTLVVKSNYGYNTTAVEMNYKVYQNKALCMEDVVFPALDVKLSNIIFEINQNTAKLKYLETNISNTYAENISDDGVKK